MKQYMWSPIPETTFTRPASLEALHVQPDSRDEVHAAGLGVDYELYGGSQHDPAPEIDSA